jgi:hypothetical protein
MKPNYGLDRACTKSFNLTAKCRTHDNPEILLWGDSFAMHLAQGIISSNPDVKLVQLTNSACGPFFDIAPLSQKYTKKWAESCLDFNGQVRNFIKSNSTVKYVVISSPLSQYLKNNFKLFSRNKNILEANIDTVTSELLKTLDELRSYGVTPIIFSPPPATTFDIGRCLAKAELHNIKLDLCDFDSSTVTRSRLTAYQLLKSIEKKYRVVWLNNMICQNATCKSSIDKNWLFVDSEHLSYEGSAELGKRFNFYRLITE